MKHAVISADGRRHFPHSIPTLPTPDFSSLHNQIRAATTEEEVRVPETYQPSPEAGLILPLGVFSVPVMCLVFTLP